MSWEKEIDELAKRKSLAYEMGGREKVARQHEFNKLTIRERVDAIVDDGSFHEIGTLAGKGEYNEDGELIEFTPSNFVFGTANIDGRPVVVSGDDFTVRGGSADASILTKRTKAEGLARDLQLPHIRLIDGMGGGGSVKTIEMAGRTYIPELAGWDVIVDHLSIAPSVSLALGSVAGIGAARVTTSHYSIIVSGSAQMMIAGPALVDWAKQGAVTKEELGHARIHTRNGAIDDEAQTETEAFERVRKFLSYLPNNIYELPPRTRSTDNSRRREEKLLNIVPKNPRKAYDMRAIVHAVVDKNTFFEIGVNWGCSVMCGFARMDGIPVAMMASDPQYYGGAWTADSCRKLTRFIDLATTFHLPLIHLEDCPGFLIGKEAEDAGTIRHGSQTLAALMQSTAPYCCIVIRKSFGVAGASNHKTGSHHFRYAWPSGDWGSLPIEGGIEVAYKAELARAKDYDAHLAMIKERLNRVRSPFRSAEFFEIEEIIDPRDTRPVLCRWANLARRVTTAAGRYTFFFQALNESVRMNQKKSPDLKESFFQRLFINSPIGIYIVQDGNFRFVNREFRKISGFSEKELIGMESLEIVYPEDVKSVKENALKMLKGERVSPYLYRIFDHKMEVRWIIESVTSIIYGGKKATLGYFMDNTEHERAKEAIRLSEDKFQKAFRSSPEWMVITTLEGGLYVDVNETFLRTTGYKREEVIGLSAVELSIWADMGQRAKMVERLKKQGKVSNFEARFRMKGGAIRTVLWSAELIDYGDEKCLLAVTRDITHRKQMEKEKLRTEKLKGVLEMAGATCHELNQPLQIMYCLIDRLMEEQPDNETIRKMDEQIMRMKGITDKVNSITSYETKDYVKGSKIIDIEKASGREG